MNSPDSSSGSFRAKTGTPWAAQRSANSGSGASRRPSRCRSCSAISSPCRIASANVLGDGSGYVGGPVRSRTLQQPFQVRRRHQFAEHAVNPRLHVEFLDQRGREIQQRDGDRIVSGDACAREIDRWRAIEVRELREFLSRDRSVRQFDLRDEAPRQPEFLGDGSLAQATVFARLP